MIFTDKNIESYCIQHSQDTPDYLIKLERATYMRTLAPQMLSGPLVGRFLSFVSNLIKPTCIVEVGTFTGYSALCLAEGLAPNGILHTFEVNDELLPTIQEFQSLSPYADSIQVHIGRGEDLLKEMNLAPELAFLDAGKLNYLDHYELLMTKMQSGGVIIVDNVLWSGKVARPATDDDTRALQAFNTHVASDKRCKQIMLPIRDGLTLLIIN